MAQFEKILAEMNPAQMEAVNHVKGPLLILAGAGSGKTRVLTHRIANVIASGEASPLEILAVTFTNKAAREMESRTLSLLQQQGTPVLERLWISTFHSICVRILRDEIHLLDYQPFFNIYDDSDQLTLLKRVLSSLNIDDKTHPAKGFQSRINEAKRLGLVADQVTKSQHLRWDKQSCEVYKAYETEMKKANCLDFGDLLLRVYELFQMYPDILEKYQDRFRFIFIDEYQDTNHIQYLLVRMLAAKHRNLCVVGDEDQSIYSWRGADISNILEFEKDFPEAKVIKLEENYRSTNVIVEAASDLIKNNTQRKNKKLFTATEGGEKITIREESNEYEEARYVVKKIEGLHQTENISYRDVAIFYRTNAQSRVLEDHLRSLGIPYKIIGGVKFYERREIKDMISYLKVLVNPTDEVALKRIINTPARGIGKTTISRIEAAATQHALSFYEAILYAAEHRLVHAGAARKLREFRSLIDKLIEAMPGQKLSETFLNVLEATQYAVRLKEDGSPEALARIENLEEFDNAINQFEEERGKEATLQNFLEEMALVSDADQVDQDEDYVTLMTLHISKGLEYPIVFIVGMEDGLFPSARSFDSLHSDALEEERRLAYVGMTRAQKNFYFLTYARQRRVWGQEQFHPPSRFLKEIPEHWVTQESSIRRPRFLERHGASTQKASYGPRFQKKSSSNPFPDYENATDSFADESEAAAYQKGMQVRHPTFGVGSIFEIEGQGQNQKVSVLFNNKTLKKFVTKYARLERV